MNSTPSISRLSWDNVPEPVKLDLSTFLPVSKFSKLENDVAIVANAHFIAYPSTKASFIRIISQADASHVTVSTRRPNSRVKDLAISNIANKTLLAALVEAEDKTESLFRWEISHTASFQDDIYGDEVANVHEGQAEAIQFYPNSPWILVTTRSTLSPDNSHVTFEKVYGHVSVGSTAKHSTHLLGTAGGHVYGGSPYTPAKVDSISSGAVSKLVWQAGPGFIVLRNNNEFIEGYGSGLGEDPMKLTRNGVAISKKSIYIFTGTTARNKLDPFRLLNRIDAEFLGDDLYLVGVDGKDLIVIADRSNNRIVSIKHDSGVPTHIAVQQLPENIKVLTITATENAEGLESVLCDIYLFHSTGLGIIQLPVSSLTKVEPGLSKLILSPQPKLSDYLSYLGSGPESEEPKIPTKALETKEPVPNLRSTSAAKVAVNPTAGLTDETAQELPAVGSKITAAVGPATDSRANSAKVPKQLSSKLNALDPTSLNQIVDLASKRLVDSGQFVSRGQFDEAQRDHQKWVESATAKFEALLDRFERVLNSAPSSSASSRAVSESWPVGVRRDSPQDIWTPPAPGRDKWTPFSAFPQPEEDRSSSIWGPIGSDEDKSIPAIPAAQPNGRGPGSGLTPKKPRNRSKLRNTSASREVTAGSSTPGSTPERTATPVTEKSVSDKATEAIGEEPASTPRRPAVADKVSLLNPQAASFKSINFGVFESLAKEIASSAGDREQLVNKFKILDDTVSPEVITSAGKPSSKKEASDRQLAFLAALSGISLLFRGDSVKYDTKTRAFDWAAALVSGIRPGDIGPHSRLVVSALNRVRKEISSVGRDRDVSQVMDELDDLVCDL